MVTIKTTEIDADQQDKNSEQIVKKNEVKAKVKT